MRNLLFLSLLLIPAFLPAQQAGLPLSFNSYAIKLCVAKDQSLMLTTRAGEVGVAGSINGDWRRVDVSTDKMSSGTLLEQPNFFNKDTGFVSGFINKNGKYNIIYHTTSSGRKWEAVDFGQDGWIDDAVNLDNGEAWLSVAGSGIAYTSDYGFRWKRFKNPELKQRFTHIFFNTQRQGIAGSLWDMIAYTADNCSTWKLLPTPLGQGKYNKTDKQSRPEFDNVAIFKSYFLAKQEGLVFYSKRDSVNWVSLPDYTDFYTDAENSALFFRTNKGKYVRSDSSLMPIYVFECAAAGYDAKCKNGSLFIVANNKMVQLNSRNEVVSTLFVSTAAGVQPLYIGYCEKGSIGLSDNKIFRQKDYNGSWDYMFSLPFPPEKGVLSVTNEGLLMYDRKDDSLFYINLSSGKLKKAVSKTNMIGSFAKKGIKKLVFSQGSSGCFHNYADQLAYTSLDGVFGDIVETNHNSESRMPDNDESIPEDDITGFAGKLSLIFDEEPGTTIDDLAFGVKEYEQCKKDILDFKASLQKEKSKETSFNFPRNNLDFDRLLSLVDSVQHIDKNTLNVLLMNLHEIVSTTTNWKKIEFVNGEGTVLSIRSSYYEPNAFYFPWIVSLNGYTILTTSMEINRFVQKVYPAFLSANSAQRVKVLHTLVKQLY